MDNTQVFVSGMDTSNYLSSQVFTDAADHRNWDIANYQLGVIYDAIQKAAGEGQYQVRIVKKELKWGEFLTNHPYYHKYGLHPLTRKILVSKMFQIVDFTDISDFTIAFYGFGKEEEE